MVKEEAIIGFASGAVYGMTSLVVGHPLDTLKTKMQAQNAYMKGSSLNVFISTIKNEGIVGLYRGCVPPLLGASVLRSVQFGVFEAAFSALQPKANATDDSLWSKGVPRYSIFGINSNIILAGIASGAARAAVECPLEVAKIRRQVGQSWTFSGLYRGLGVNMARNIPLLSTFFIFLDISKSVDLPPQWRPLITGSVCSTLAWTLVWPFDVIKSQVQSSTEKSSFLERVRVHYANHGLRGFFRGYGPGATRSLIANGLSMVMYVYTQQYLVKYFKEEQ